jgi:exodeoxyribonuclease-3
VLCLQEIKASPAQLGLLADIAGYHCRWHGDKGYSGVALLVSERIAPECPQYVVPPFDFEARIVTVRLPELAVASVYVPNGGKDFDAKMRFLQALDSYAAEAAREGRQLILCGDLNVARTERDIHPKERKPNQIGARAEERALIESIIAKGLVDVGRALDPDNDNLFTWWAPWRNMKQRNIGWRIDYVLASAALASRAKTSTVRREIGTSDHGPVVVEFDLS